MKLRRLNTDQTSLLKAGTLSAAELARLAKGVVEENRQIFNGLFAAAAGKKRPAVKGIALKQPQPKVKSSLSRGEIHLVVKRNIKAEYDHPKVVEAVTDYLYNHFLMI